MNSSSALGQVTDKWLSPREVHSLLLPGLAFSGSVGLLVLHRFGWSAARHWWMGIDGASKAVLAAAAAGGLLIFALVLAQFLLPLSRLFEGYWKEGKPGRWL